MDIKEIQEQAYQRGLADGRSRALLEQEVTHGMAAFCDVSCIRIISCEDSSVHYLQFPDGLRLIQQDGKYVGWYACDGHEAPDFKQREKLVELIEKGCICPNDANPFYCDAECQYNDSLCCGNERLADYLIANGVRLDSKQATSDEKQATELPRDFGRWIPVEERKPDVVISDITGKGYSEAVNVLTSGHNVITAIYDGEEFIGDASFWEAEDEVITHWTPVLLPLPEPPKENNDAE